MATLVEVLGADFIKYMEAFKPFLHVGLRNVAEYQVCAAAVGVVGDICRALAQQFTPYANEIMAILLENLSNNNVHRQVDSILILSTIRMNLKFMSLRTIQIKLIVALLVEVFNFAIG